MPGTFVRRIRSHFRVASAGLMLVLSVTACKRSSTDPTPPGEGIQLVPGTTVGKSVFPIGNTAQGGQGQPISGVACGLESIAYHAHPHLSLFVNGEQIAIPLGVGITDVREQNGVAVPGGPGSCPYWIHTHDATGILHVEPPVASTTLTLGQAFDVWGQPLSADNVAGFQGAVTAYVNQERYLGDVRSIPLSRGTQINLQVGTPLVQPPVYILPKDY